MIHSNARYTAFSGQVKIASGALADVALEVKRLLEQEGAGSILIFDQDTSQLAEVDFRGSAEDVLNRLGPAEEETLPKRGPGRPKLGVVPREVTLLPRHWDWLATQPGGASVALRKLVEAARKSGGAKDEVRRAQESVHRFMHAMAGDLPGFEEASRAFYAGQEATFQGIIAAWPDGIRQHLEMLAGRAFSAMAGAEGTPEQD